MVKWKKSNPNLFKKLGKILEAIQEAPRNGIGHPEPLIGGEGITYSRRITAHDRIIYYFYFENSDICRKFAMSIKVHFKSFWK